MHWKLLAGLALATVSCSAAHAAGIGLFVYGDAVDLEWTLDDGFAEFDIELDADSWRLGFALDTAPAVDKLLNYRLQVGLSRLQVDLAGSSTELFELDGIHVGHTFGFQLLHARAVKLWAGPHLRTGFYVGDLVASSDPDTVLFEFGAGGAVGLNFNPGRAVTLSLETGYYVAGYLGLTESDVTDITGDGGGPFAALSVLFRLGRDRQVEGQDQDEDGVADRLDDCADTPRGATVAATGCPTDADDDGIADGIDKCVETDSRAIVDATGCPLDSDADGIADGIDKCVETDLRAIVDATGCPLDSDADGIADGIDDCVKTDSRAIVDATGCPVDTDDDGIADGIDKCAATDSRAIVDATGCPVDTDGDGVADGLDGCPETPSQTEVDLTGCPAPIAAIQPDMRAPVVLEGVKFDFDSTTLSPASIGVLERVARSLEDWPELRVEVGGHTDTAGDEPYNVSLSLQRAEAVREYLVQQGIDAGRITVKGYGTSEPIGDNRTTQGREQNRRVELKKL